VPDVGNDAAFARAAAYLRDLRDTVSAVGGRAVFGRPASLALTASAYVLPFAIVAATTAALLPLRDLVPNDLVALAYVLAVILVADFGPTKGWWVAPVSAFLVLNYFFTRPFYTFFVSSPHDVVMLALFLIVGIVSSRQVRRLRFRTRQAEESHRDLQLLNTLSTTLVSSVTSEDMVRSLREPLTGVGFGRVVLFVSDEDGDGRWVSYGDEPDPAECRTAEWVMRENKALGIPRTADATESAEPWPVCAPSASPWGEEVPGAFVPLISPKRLEGVLLVVPGRDGPALLEGESRLVVSAANLATTFLGRRALQRQANAAALLRETERMKSNLLSAISHDIKTPLAAAQMRVTGMLEVDMPMDAEHQREDLAAVAENLDRLNDTIGDLLDLSRLESEAWRPKPETYELGEILSATLARLPEDQRARVEVTMPEEPLQVTVDFRQWERAVRNVLENALLYSEGPVRLDARRSERVLELSVEDRGSGVPPADRERIFDRFTRGDSAGRSARGTGLGLAITKEVVHAHGGTVRVEDARPGARFLITLPLRRRT
jgi:two-component system, OmpR family, sensor histidine kinase KdpD